MLWIQLHFTVMNLHVVLVCAWFRQTAMLVVEHGVVLEFKPGRGIYAQGKTNYVLNHQALLCFTSLTTRVFNSGRLGANTPKNFSPYAQILRRGRHDVQINLLLITFICL